MRIVVLLYLFLLITLFYEVKSSRNKIIFVINSTIGASAAETNQINYYRTSSNI
jgi:hypothetical protein